MLKSNYGSAEVATQDSTMLQDCIGRFRRINTDVSTNVAVLERAIHKISNTESQEKVSEGKPKQDPNDFISAFIECLDCLDAYNNRLTDQNNKLAKII